MVFFLFALLYVAFSFLLAFLFGLTSDSTGSNRTGTERAVTSAIARSFDFRLVTGDADELIVARVLNGSAQNRFEQILSPPGTAGEEPIVCAPIALITVCGT
jgi:hypothetical protein